MAEPSLTGRRVLVCGFGLAGRSAAAALQARGARVALTADRTPDTWPDSIDWLGPLDAVPAGVDLLVASPGLPPTHPLLVDAQARGVPVWGEVELAWRLRGPDAAPWLALTGTNGKTTTVHMLESMLRAAGLRAVAVGNVGEPLIDAVVAAEPYDVLAVELSSQQLHFAPSIAPGRRGPAEPGARPPELARLARGLRAGQDRGLGRRPSRSATPTTPRVAARLPRRAR